MVLLNFWASWCPPCIEETPSLNAFAEQMGPKGVVVLGVSIDRNEDSYRKFISKYGIQFDTSKDPEGDVMQQLRDVPDSGNLHHRPVRQGSAEDH